MVERFSDTMFMVIGSLMLQKILIAITSNPTFSLLVTGIGFFFLLMIWFKQIPMAQVTYRIFLVTVIARFSIAMVLVMNSLVSSAFLEDEIN